MQPQTHETNSFWLEGMCAGWRIDAIEFHSQIQNR